MDELPKNEVPFLPNEMLCEIFSLLDLSGIRKAREVSKHWKALVRVRSSIQFLCQLTDETFPFAVNSEEIISCLQIHDFKGQGNEVMSPTSGTGFLFGNADSIKFIGNNIEPAKIPKMMKFAVDSLKMLEFKNCEIDTLRPFIEAKQAFIALQQLSITFTHFPKVNDTLALEGFATPDLGPLLPSLKRLKIFLDNPEYIQPSFHNTLSFYLAIGRLFVKLMSSLKDLEIEKTVTFRMVLGWTIETADLGDFVLSPVQTTQLQQCLEAFQEMALEKLRISPENSEHPWVIETQLLRRQQNLKEVVINQTVVMIEDGLRNLTPWLPINRTPLTSVKITLEFNGDSSPLDLGAFAGCPNLKILWLVLFHSPDHRHGEPIWASSSQFSNLDALPKTISSLRLKCDNEDVDNRNWKHQLYILSHDQIKWIIKNLGDLECLWAQLVLQTRRNGNGEQPLAQQNVNWRPNMTLETFKNLISMPKLRNLKLDMLKANQLEADFEDNEDVVEDKEFQAPVISLDVIQDYLDVCRNDQKEKVSSVTRYPVQGDGIRFWEVSIHKSNTN